MGYSIAPKLATVHGYALAFRIGAALLIIGGVLVLVLLERGDPPVSAPLLLLSANSNATDGSPRFYTAVGTVAFFGFVSWPTAALIGGGHALHQRAGKVVRAGILAQI